MEDLKTDSFLLLSLSLLIFGKHSNQQNKQQPQTSGQNHASEQAIKDTHDASRTKENATRKYRKQLLLLSSHNRSDNIPRRCFVVGHSPVLFRPFRLFVARGTHLFTTTAKVGVKRG